MKKTLAAVGSYASETSDNIFFFKLLPDGRFEKAFSLSAGINPSYLKFSEGRFLYVVNERNTPDHGQDGLLKTYQVSDDLGSAVQLSSVSTRGADPCSIEISPDGLFLLVTNYSGASIIIFSLNGGIPKFRQKIDLAGSGPHPQRQVSSHPHSVRFSIDGTHLYVADLGTDAVHIYGWDPSKNIPASEGKVIKISPGAGPRMLREWNGDLYIVNELGNSVSIYSLSARRFVGEILTRKREEGESWAGHMEIEDKCIFVSNRGDDTIFIHSPGRSEWYPCGGAFPRFFALKNSRIYIANQNSGNISSYALDAQGLKNLRTEAYLPSPSCIDFL